MNETVKAALLEMRQGAMDEVRNSANGVALYRERLADKERWHERELARLADIELHLRDNGVDLAAVDAEKARGPQHAGLLDRNAAGALAASYERSCIGLQAAQPFDIAKQYGINRNNTFDPTAGLAKALDEA